MGIESLKVLVIDDDKEILETVTAALNEMGISQITEETDMASARTAADSAPDAVNLIISSWDMPGMTGIELLEYLRARDIKTPFIMMTARDDKESVLEAKKLRVDAYLKKPFEGPQLQDKIKAIFESKFQDVEAEVAPVAAPDADPQPEAVS